MRVYHLFAMKVPATLTNLEPNDSSPLATLKRYQMQYSLGEFDLAHVAQVYFIVLQ
jgi:hypothetical protein